jgi:hypothetical protein
MVLALLGLLATGVDVAADERNEAARDCAAALAETSGVREWELIRVIALSGAADWRLWLDGESADVGGFCEIDDGRVARVVPIESRWPGRTPVPPPAYLSSID